MKHALLPLDILAIAMAGLCAVGLLAGAMGWVPSWLAAVLVIGSCAGLFGGLAAILHREGMPGRQIATGIGAIVAGAALIAVVALLMGGVGCLSDVPDDSEAVTTMVEYLEGKYSRSFDVEDYADTPYWYGNDTMVAHPVDARDEVFLVLQDNQDAGVIRDTYLLARWSTYAMDKYGPPVRSALGVDVVFKPALIVPYDAIPDQPADADEAPELTQTADSQVVFYLAVSSSDVPDLRDISEALYEVYQIAGSAGCPRYSIAVASVDELADFEDYVRTGDINNTAWGNAGAGVNGYLVAGWPREVESPEDLITSYKAVGQ